MMSRSGLAATKTKTDFRLSLIFVESKTRFNISASNPQPLLRHKVSTASAESTLSTGCREGLVALPGPLLQRHQLDLRRGEKALFRGLPNNRGLQDAPKLEVSLYGVIAQAEVAKTVQVVAQRRSALNISLGIPVTTSGNAEHDLAVSV